MSILISQEFCTRSERKRDGWINIVAGIKEKLTKETFYCLIQAVIMFLYVSERSARTSFFLSRRDKNRYFQVYVCTTTKKFIYNNKKWLKF